MNYFKKKYFIISIFLIFVFGLFMLNTGSSSATGLANRLKGRILLQVEQKGEAWYVNPDNEKRYYLGRPADAFCIMRELGLGISNKDFDSYNGYAPSRLSGKILLKVEENGEAYYVNPIDLKMHYLGRPDDAFNLMRELGLGISNDDLDEISQYNTASDQKENFAQIYVTWFSHNEIGGYWQELINNKDKYLEYRADLIRKINLLNKYKTSLNWESDYHVLQAMQKWERGGILDETNGKNILKWMNEDMGVVVDPHRHPSQYSYADIAYEIKKLGVEPSGVLGGFRLYLCGDPNNPMTFDFADYMEESSIKEDGIIKGNIYDYTWEAEILAQPAIAGHAFDDWSSGVWKPTVGGDFFKHDPNGEFVVIGTGYPHTKSLIGETNSGGSKVWYDGVEYVEELINKIESGQLEVNKIYTSSVHFRDSMRETSYEAIEKVLKEYKPLVDSGKVVYEDYESVVDVWKTKYNEEPNRVSIELFNQYDNIVGQVKEMWGKVCSTVKTGDINNQNGGYCGDGSCEGPEDSIRCPQDCI